MFLSLVSLYFLAIRNHRVLQQSYSEASVYVIIYVYLFILIMSKL